MRTLEQLKGLFPKTWAEANEDPVYFCDLLYVRGYITEEEFTRFMDELYQAGRPPPEKPGPPEVLTPEELAALQERLAGGMLERTIAQFEIAWRQFLKEFWSWSKEHIGPILDILWQSVKAVVTPLLEPANDKIEEWGHKLYKMAEAACAEGGPITPERAPALGMKLFGAALTFGLAAHAASIGLELVHPLKSLGFGQAVGILGDMASFGPISAATMGVLIYGTVRRPFQYAVNAVTRSQIPDEMTLQIMAVKPDIPMDQFVSTMKYHGYSDYWIDRIKRTMFHEPRYFELKMMSEDEAASEEWLFEKSRRAGFNEADSKIMVSSYIKSATRSQRQDYYKQAFYLYKEGFIDDGDFDAVLDRIEMRPEGKRFAKYAAEYAYRQDVIKDEIKYWTDNYLKDVINATELSLYLTLLGIRSARVLWMVGLAKTRKRNKPSQAESKQLEQVMDQARAKYAQAYVYEYRKGIINLKQLEANLIALGIHPELAEATAALEEARKAELPAA